MATGTQSEKSVPVTPGASPFTDRLVALWARVRLEWTSMRTARRGWTLTVTFLLIAMAGLLLWSMLRTDWRTLYADMDAEDARQASQILTHAQIPFQPTSNGTGIRVPAAQLDRARLATAAEGTIQSGRMGFEIFDKSNHVGSEFDEQVKYQRALEGELEHTVGSLADVESARIHLALPHDPLSREHERPAKASVVLRLRHRSLADGEPEAIRNLVASAVDELTPEHVVLVDAAGNLPLGLKTADAMHLSTEQALEDKLIATLEPVTGAGNVRVSVTLDYAAATTEETQEIYDPDRTVALSMQHTEQISNSRSVTGVAAMAPNVPDSQALPAHSQQAASPEHFKTESGTYAASKTVTHTLENPGRVRRLTAAIVVNDRLTAFASKGSPAVWQHRSPDELRSLTALAQAAVGFDSTRGDMLTVQNLAFDENRPAPAISLPVQALNAAENSPVVKTLGMLIGWLIIIAVGVRHVLRRRGTSFQLVARSAGKQSPAGGASASQSVLRSADQAGLAPERIRAQEILNQVSGHLKREPAQSSRLLQSWIHFD